MPKVCRCEYIESLQSFLVTIYVFSAYELSPLPLQSLGATKEIACGGLICAVSGTKNVPVISERIKKIREREYTYIFSVLLSFSTPPISNRVRVLEGWTHLSSNLVGPESLIDG